MKLKTLLTVVILALVFQGIACAATFRDTLPAENPEAAQIVSSAANPPITTSPTSEGGAVVGTPDPVVPQVELYVTSWCPYCKQAENFFRSQGIPYTAYDVEKDSSAARRKEQLDSSGGVPLAIINGQKIHGFSETAYREALKKKP